MTTFLDNLAPDYIRSLPVYRPGKPVETLERELGITGALKIASNENPIGPSPRAIEAAHLALANINLYPDGGAYRLRHALSERHGVAPEELVFGAGSNEIIHMIVQAFCRPGRDQVLTHEYAFISYRLAALSHGLEFVGTPTTPDLACDVDALIAAMSSSTKVIFLANPNNPTGSYVERSDFERILAAVPEHALLVVDEAYHEYAIAAADDYPLSQRYRTSNRPNILTLRTFSKIYGLAGLRVGYAIGDRRVVELLNRVRRPFNLNALAQAAALAALDDEQHVSRSRDNARRGIETIIRVTKQLGYRAYASLGNFILLHVGGSADETYRALLQQGVIVRPMGLWGLPEHIRISLPSVESLARVTEGLESVLGS